MGYELHDALQQPLDAGRSRNGLRQRVLGIPRLRRQRAAATEAQSGFEYFLGYELQKYGGKDDVLLIADNNEQTQAFIGQVRTTGDFNEKLHLSAGLRYNSPSDAESQTVWTATAKYDIRPDLFVRTVVGTNFRLPTAEELYAIDPFELGNPNLMPEKSRNLNVSIGGALPFRHGAATAGS